MTSGQLAQRTSKRKESKSKIRDLTVCSTCFHSHAYWNIIDTLQIQLQTVGNRLNDSTIENEQIQVKICSSFALEDMHGIGYSLICEQFKLKEREEEIRLLRKSKQDLQFRVQVSSFVVVLLS
jgi:hypothetical protein